MKKILLSFLITFYGLSLFAQNAISVPQKAMDQITRLLSSSHANIDATVSDIKTTAGYRADLPVLIKKDIITGQDDGWYRYEYRVVLLNGKLYLWVKSAPAAEAESISFTPKPQPYKAEIVGWNSGGNFSFAPRDKINLQIN
jgi:hypothetical protein